MVNVEILDQLQKKRIVVLGDGIDQRVVDDLRRRMLKLALDSDGVIRLLIDSDGGNVRPSYNLCDFIQGLSVPVAGIVVGTCMSMAVPILQACGIRHALPGSSFYLHYISIDYRFGLYRSDDEARALFERRLKEAREYQVFLENTIARRSKRSLEEIRRVMRDGDVLDTRMSPQEAKEFGLIDSIETYQAELFEGINR